MHRTEDYSYLQQVLEASITNMIVQDFYSDEDGQAALIYFSFSTLEIEGLTASNTTGLFKLAGSTVRMNSLNVSNVTNAYQSQFLFDMSEVTFIAQSIQYIGNKEYSTLIPLIGGDKNNIQIDGGTLC